MATALDRVGIVKSRGRKGDIPLLGNFLPAGDHGQDTSISVATTITLTDTGASHIMFQNSSATVNLRYTLDGTAPTATLGFLLEPGWYAIVPVEGVTLRVIESGGTGQVDYQGIV